MERWPTICCAGFETSQINSNSTLAVAGMVLQTVMTANDIVIVPPRFGHEPVGVDPEGRSAKDRSILDYAWR